MADVSGFPGTTGHVAVNTSCRGCHTAPETGSNLASVFMNIGVSDSPARTRDLPLYTVVEDRTGDTLRSSDPGRAMVTGRWADVGEFKVPGLRGLAARAPYFHNGSAATLRDVVRFYESQSDPRLTAVEEADLTVFLGAL